VDGRLDAATLRQAVLAVVRRHETLRTGFVADGSQLHRTPLAAVECDLEVETGRLAGEDELTAFVARPFPLDGRLLVRAGRAGELPPAVQRGGRGTAAARRQRRRPLWVHDR
jgi:hypothetical protein